MLLRSSIAPATVPVAPTDPDRLALRGIALKTQEKLTQASILLRDAISDNNRLLAALGTASTGEVVDTAGELEEEEEDDDMMEEDDGESFRWSSRSLR